MFKINGDLAAEVSSGLILVAFDRATGQIHATHGVGLGKETEEEIESDQRRLRDDVQHRVGHSAVIDVISLPMSEIQKNWPHRIDPTTRRLASRESHAAPSKIHQP